IILGGALYLIFVDRDRRSLGPQRGKGGPLAGIRGAFKRKQKAAPVYKDKRKKLETRAEKTVGEKPAKTAKFAKPAKKTGLGKRLAAVGLVTSATLVLSGCSADYWPQHKKESGPQQLQQQKTAPTVSAQQIERIVADIVKVSNEADKAKNAELLKSRFESDALAQRVANYKIRGAVADYAVVPPYILDQRLGYELIQQTSGWPRHVLVTVGSAAAPPTAEKPAAAAASLGLLLVQKDAHTNFKVSQVFALRGGVQLPEAAAADIGTAVLDNAVKTLRVSPAELGKDYALALVQGKNGEAAKKFNVNADPIMAAGGASWVASEQSRGNNSEGKATYSVTAAPTETKPVAISTGKGGALVMLSINEFRKIAADDRSELPVGNVVKAIAGFEGKVKMLEQQVQHQLIFYVPGANDQAKPELLGSSSELVGAKK
ncbi:MAG: hypothetical protein Q4C71_04580, partial [Microbacteriaceae bacterium]|nr:hypothetical protein [Microbacteriaceae bacterium]